MQAKRFINAIGSDPGNCVLVVGSGLSKKGVRKGGKGLPDWDELMKLMIAHLKESGRCNVATIDQLCLMMKEDPPRYLDVAEEFYKAHEHDADGYEQFLRQHLAPTDLVDSEVHKVILNVGFRGIVSYNFDMVFEKQSDVLDKVVYPSLLEQIGHFRRKGFFAKIHGCISGPAKQLILTRTSFDRLAADTKYAQLVRTIFLGHVVLCVGFSLRDPDFQSILSDLKNYWGTGMPPLYALVRNPGENASSDWLTKGVDILSYSDHSETPEFFRKLAALSAKRINVTARPSSTRKQSRPETSAGLATEEEERKATDRQTTRLQLLVEKWTKNQKIGEINSSVSDYLKQLQTVSAREATLFHMAALCPDHTPFLCPHLLALSTRGCLDLALKIFCGVAEKKGLYQLPPHPLHVPLHRWVLREKLWEKGSADYVMKWLLNNEWVNHGVDLETTFREIFDYVLKKPEHKDLEYLYDAAEDVPGALEEIEKIVFDSGFVRNSLSEWGEKSIVREICEQKYKRAVRGRDLPPNKLLAAAEAADRMMPDADDIGCITDAIKTLLREFPHCTYLTLHGSSSAYDPSKAKEILDALASLKKLEQQRRVIAGISHWGVFEERSSHSGEEAEVLRKGLLIPLWWRYSSEMRIEYFRYGDKERMMLGASLDGPRAFAP